MKRDRSASEAARILGRIKTPKKAKASKLNGSLRKKGKSGGR